MGNAALRVESWASSQRPVRPFLKWAGGKGQLLAELFARTPQSYNQYIEPFVGGGAFFFALQPNEAVLADLNCELMNAYQVVRDQTEELIRSLSEHRYDREYYYSIRNADRSKDFVDWGSVQRASRLIFLNRTCFNGLYRVNSKGQFNVPFGRYKDPTICDALNLRACAERLQSATLVTEDFRQSLSRARAGDFVYLDPPYLPVSKTSAFTSYTHVGFGFAQQEELSEACKELDRKGAYFLLSNSDRDEVRAMYKDFTIERVTAKRMVNSKADGRGKVYELIIRNY